MDVTLPSAAIDVLSKGLSEAEQLALSVKASLDTIREEQAAWMAKLIYVQGPSSICFAFSFIFL